MNMSEELIEIRVERLSSDIPLPRRMHDLDAGYDVCSRIEVTVPPKDFVVIPTGLIFEIPPGFRIDVRSRSGLAAKYGIFVLNSPGTIDAGYRDEVKIILANFSNQPFLVRKGDRIAQLVVSRVDVDIKWKIVAKVSRINDRGGGFGSTGI